MSDCNHPVHDSQFLAVHEQVHLDSPDTHCMLACLFLCKSCGKIYSSNVEAIRGYMPNGEVPMQLMTQINKRKQDIQLEQRAHMLAQQLIKTKETK